VNATRDALAIAQLVVFVALAAVAVFRWRQRGGVTRAWLAVTFSTLAVVVLVARWLPMTGHEGAVDYERKVLVAVLLLFPYFLYRFAATFRRPARWVEIGAAALTVAACGGIFLFDKIPTAGEKQPPGFIAYIYVIAAQWALLTGYVAFRLWRAGRGQPTVTRRRMRTLSLGSAGMAIIILVGVAAPAPGTDATAAGLVTAFIALATGPLFLLGFSPPRLVLAAWRRPEELKLRTAETGLMAAMTPIEVAEVLLPHVARVMGARWAMLNDGNSNTLAAYGSPSHDPKAATPLEIHVGKGMLTIEASPYSPYFGREEVQILEQLARLTDVALQRSVLSDRERQLAAELQQANEAMREFVAIASHDLRTPITLVSGFSQLLLSNYEALDDATKLENLRAIHRQGLHLARLVDDLLTVSRIDAGALAPDPGAVKVADAVDEVLRELDLRDRFTIEIPEDACAIVDRDHLTRVLRNYIANALNYGEPPFAIHATEEPDGTTVIRVRDSGPGVPLSFQDRLFQRFARDDSARARDKRGTGLGLSIVRGLARAAGGDAWYEPNHPKGACFAVRFPR
jgi:signal transduction histidine kinase